MQVQENATKFVIPEDIPVPERTAFMGAAAAAHKAGQSHFNFGGKKHKVTMKPDTAKAIADDVQEAKQVDEISKDMVGRYVKKAGISMADAGRDTMENDPERRKRGINKIVNRRMGTADAVKKLTGKARVPATESEEVKLCPHCDGSAENHSPECKMANKAAGNETAEANPKLKESKWPIYSRIMEKKDSHTKGAIPAQDIDDEASGKEKEFTKQHGGLDGNKSEIDGEKAAAETAKNIANSVKQAPKRPADKTDGDKKAPKQGA